MTASGTSAVAAGPPVPEFAHKAQPDRRYAPGEHTWHYNNRNDGDSFRITVLRYRDPSEPAYCVCVMDTRSNPHAETDAERICAALNTTLSATPVTSEETR